MFFGTKESKNLWDVLEKLFTQNFIHAMSVLSADTGVDVYFLYLFRRNFQCSASLFKNSVGMNKQIIECGVRNFSLAFLGPLWIAGSFAGLLNLEYSTNFVFVFSEQP